MKSCDWFATAMFASNCLKNFCILLSDLYVVYVWQSLVTS